jgi:dimethylhistidine N-methyltransferase
MINKKYLISDSSQNQEIFTSIAEDTIRGLSSNPKYLLPKYFYDDEGSGIFHEIMYMPGYYLTECELEIFIKQGEEIAKTLIGDNPSFNIIEPGSGNGVKTKILIHYLADRGARLTYMPIDISVKVNADFEENLKAEFPWLEVLPQTGDYLNLFTSKNNIEGTKQVIIFLGSNIGNLNSSELDFFLTDLSEFTREGDKVLIGFDLIKSPEIIMKAYNDPYGLTKKFNLNHLSRLNRELDADFNIDKFEYHTEYNPVNGKVKSFLVSTISQRVTLNAIGESFSFDAWEPVFMELSRKFDPRQIELLASDHGFFVERNFADLRNYFIDSVWTKG